MSELTYYTTLACAYLGIAATEAINPRVEEDELVLIYDRGIHGAPKVRISLEILDDLAAANPELAEPAELEAEEERPSSLKSLLLSKMAKPSVSEVTADATDGALRLMDEYKLDCADILNFMGEDRRINARDVRGFIRSQEEKWQ